MTKSSTVKAKVPSIVLDLKQIILSTNPRLDNDIFCLSLQLNKTFEDIV